MEAPVPSATSLDVSLGQKLRLIREANGLSQRELARRAGVTNSSVSLIEQGQVSPSVASLARLLAAIPVSLAHFFACLPAEEPARFFATDKLSDSNYDWAVEQSLPPEMSVASAPLRRLLVRGDSGEAPLFSAQAQVFWLVTGSLWVTAGTQRRALKAGEGVYIPAGQAYRLQNGGPAEAEVLVARA